MPGESRALRVPFVKQCAVEIPLAWRRAPFVEVCANPHLPAVYEWRQETWILPALVTFDPVRALLTVHFMIPQSGTVVLHEATDDPGPGIVVYSHLGAAWS
jgi:hypothetical protein